MMQDVPNVPDWSNAEYLANLTATELKSALDAVGVRTMHVGGDSDGDVNVVFAAIGDAETMLTIGLESAGPGTIYDRATSACVTLAALSAEDFDALDATADAAIRATAWKWVVHPHMYGRRMSWHAMVYIPVADANQLTANLNALRLGGAM